MNSRAGCIAKICYTYLSLSVTRVVAQVVHEAAGHSQGMTEMKEGAHPLESGLEVAEHHPALLAQWYHHYQL
jgi:hypothetical protein